MLTMCNDLVVKLVRATYNTFSSLIVARHQHYFIFCINCNGHQREDPECGYLPSCKSNTHCFLKDNL